MSNEVFRSASPKETHEIALEFGKTLELGSIVTFSGDLGSGKTTFIRGLCAGAAEIDPRHICSPTFNYLNIYTGTKTIYHFDLYRLPRPEEFYTAGFADYLNAGGICCIEWAEKMNGSLSEHTYCVTLSYLEEEVRKIEIMHEKKIPLFPSALQSVGL